MIIAIDGPAGSGKSTTAREVARRLNALYIDTGAMYRAVALHVMEADDAPVEDLVSRIDQDIRIDLRGVDGGLRIFLNERDVTDAIRREEVSVMASRVSRYPAVRDHLVAQQRRIAADARKAGRAVVMEGRDIGTVVFPDAEYKFFLTADAKVRAARRADQIRQKGGEVDERVLYKEIVERDRLDETRTHSPLRRAADAVAIDTTGRSFEDQVDEVLRTISGNEP